jgi:hypothetical protein
MGQVISVGIGYALGWVLFNILSILSLAFEFSYLETWYRILASFVGAMVTYPAGALIARSIEYAQPPNGWAIVLWLLGGISLLGFVLGFVSDLIAIHWFGRCCTNHFSAEARADVHARMSVNKIETRLQGALHEMPYRLGLIGGWRFAWTPLANSRCELGKWA